MKYVIFAFIAGIAGAMAYFAIQGECPGGTVVKDSAECRGSGFNAADCDGALRSAWRKATQDYAPFPTQDQCLRHFPLCEAHRAVSSGFTPTPRAFCVARAGNGTIDGTAVYERIGQRISN